MPKIDLQEGEEVEFKQQWTDRALEDLAAFANTGGGTVLIGVRKDGEVIGTAAHDAEIERIANVVVSRLGLTPSIARQTVEDREIIKIHVERARGIVGYGGRYLTRVGSTNRDLSQDELARLMMERSGQSWDGVASPWGLDRIDGAVLARFAELARSRLPEIDPADPNRTLRNLGLIRDGRLTNAGVLLFADSPQELLPHAQARIGVFKGTGIVDSHDFRGALWQQLDGVMERFRRLLQVRFDVSVTEPTVEGLQRKEIWEYPLEALREGVINALIHRDYAAPGDIQIRLQDDRLQIWNPGRLPEGIRLDQLRAPNHPSIPRNPMLARAFYFAGLIEQWGTGTTRILEWCRNRGLPEPEFAEEAGGFRVVFLKDPFTPERLRAMGLNDRQVQAVLYVKARGGINNKEYRELTGAKERTATAELGDLVEKGVLERIGSTGRGTRYAARKAQMAQ
ncbi:MAG: ATP-binding protein [Armatimonadota bacterium]|nr:ATP-binding protein [Armatimonadota bacterium]